MKIFYLFMLLVLLISCKDTPKVPDAPDIKPIPKETLMRICVIGDGGTGKEDQFYVGRALSAENCGAVLYTGDVIYESGVSGADDKDLVTKFWSPYRDLIEREIVFYLSMGNHDWYLGHSGKPWIELHKKYNQIYYPNYYFAKKLEKNICIFSWETDQEKYWDDSKKYFNSIKTEYANCKFTIAFGHHPYYSSGKHGDGSSKEKDFLRAVAVGHTDMYICGHDHQLSDEGYAYDTWLGISGAAGKLRSLEKKPRGGWGANEYGYLVIDIDKEYKAHYQFVTVDKTKIEVKHKGTVVGKGLR